MKKSFYTATSVMKRVSHKPEGLLIRHCGGSRFTDEIYQYSSKTRTFSFIGVMVAMTMTTTNMMHSFIMQN